MRKGKIKAILFIIVFLLVMATAITLLLDMEREKQEVQSLGYDPYRATPAPMDPIIPTVQITTASPFTLRPICLNIRSFPFSCFDIHFPMESLQMMLS